MSEKIFFDRPEKRFYKCTEDGRIFHCFLGENTWVEVATNVNLNFLEEFPISNCSNGHERTPENLCISKDGYLRCTVCRKSKEQDRTKSNDLFTIPKLEVVQPPKIVLEFNANATVSRNHNKPGWGDVSICFNLSKKETRQLGEKLIALSEES